MLCSISIAEAGVLFLLSVWLTANAGYAIFNRQIAIYTNRWDLFRWISAYQLFSITLHQYRLSYRQRDEHEMITEWQVVRLFIPGKWFHIIWFPQMMLNTTLNSVVDDLARLAMSAPEKIVAEKVQKMFIYKVILFHIQSLPNTNKNNHKQFKIETVAGLPGEETFKKVFMSTFDHT